MAAMRQHTIFLLGLLFAGVAAEAGTLTGTVKDNAGKPQAGVIVRVTESVENGNSELVYSDAQGRFKLDATLNGRLDVRLRVPYHQDLKESITLDPKATITRQYVMKRMTNDQEISDRLPAGYHFGQLSFDKDENGHFTKYQFQRDCLTCHQLGNSLTRVPRTPEVWEVTIERMHRYLGNFDVELRKQRSKILSEGFDGKPLAVRPVFPVDPMIATAKVYEYPLPKAVQPHDAAVSTVDGLVYTVDQAADLIAITNLDTRATEYFPHPPQDAQPGPPGRMGASILHGPHSLSMGLDGKWYTTNSFGNRIGIFDPKLKQWEQAVKVVGGVYPHTVRTDKEGIIWFTLANSEQVGRFDPKTKDVKVLRLPPMRSKGTAGGTVPYGIDVSPTDGTIWVTRLFGDKLDRVDPRTLQIKEYDSPVRGPRRMRFDKQGVLWLTGYADGVIARLQPNPYDAAVGFTSEVFPMPQFAKGYQPAPYALGVHPVTQEIWINENLTDRIYRFIPKEKKFVEYPMPLEGTYTRDFSFTKDGKACTTNNPSPAAALEGGVPELFCIAP
jgi:virginiamycin B lyase